MNLLFASFYNFVHTYTNDVHIEIYLQIHNYKKSVSDIQL